LEDGPGLALPAEYGEPARAAAASNENDEDATESPPAAADRTAGEARSRPTFARAGDAHSNGREIFIVQPLLSGLQAMLRVCKGGGKVWARLQRLAEEIQKAPAVAQSTSAAPMIAPNRTPQDSELKSQGQPNASGTVTSASTTTSYVPPKTPAAREQDRSAGRPNAELLAEPDFTRAIRDLQALRVLSGFQELSGDSLLVEVSDHALTTNLSEYNFGPLFAAYYRITGWSSRTALLFSHGAQILGSYTRGGFVGREAQQ
jgi:hypothetical protein